jgi:hypothetical protein
VYAARVVWEEFEIRLQSALAACSSRFHRLVLIAAHHDSAAGLFVDPSTREILPRPLAEVVAQIHARTFEEWLRLPLQEQCADLFAYLDSFAQTDRHTLLWLLACRNAREGLVPEGATAEAANLFASDLNALLETITD